MVFITLAVLSLFDLNKYFGSQNDIVQRILNRNEFYKYQNILRFQNHDVPLEIVSFLV